uniref:Uncharacterized protein n=1 Tax=Capra hircus TaxID=9925 RepID=A0A8C2NRD8_CAPHI
FQVKNQTKPYIFLGPCGILLGLDCPSGRYHYLKTQAEEERSIAAEKKKKPDEQRLIERELAEEAQEDSVLK